MVQMGIIHTLISWRASPLHNMMLKPDGKLETLRGLSLHKPLSNTRLLSCTMPAKLCF